MKKFNRALITGASKGLGEEIVKKLTYRCENFVLVARDEKALLKLKDTLMTIHKFKGEIDILLVDLADKDAVKTITAYSKPIDLLINNAGVGYVNNFDKMKDTEVAQMVMVNNYSLTMLTHHFFAEMVKVNKGHIINIASVGGFIPLPLFSVYGATKAYVISLSRALDAEAKPRGVRVKAICPGGIKTTFNDAAGMTDELLKDNGKFMETAANVAQDVLTLIDGESDIFVPRYYNKLLQVLSKVMPGSYMAGQSKAMYEKYMPRQK
jgi:short-subunit dehydrogenase